MVLHFTHAILLLYSVALPRVQASSKRGLVYIYSSDPGDLSPLTASGTDLSWYYNYGLSPSPDTSLPFVPMLHSLPDSSSDFLNTIASLQKSSDPPSYVLTFNEPDMATSVGGSAIAPHDAAKSYLSAIAPLRTAKYNHMKVSLPSTSGSGIGLDWLKQFNASCYKLNPKYGCQSDFIATHWYGDFAGLASWLGQIHTLYPTLPVWITEYADPALPLDQTQVFFNQSTSYLGSLDYVDRYAWFGTFKANDANGFVGPNVAFLDEGGLLTDIGAWYLGKNATGNLPTDTSSVASATGFHVWNLWFVLGVIIIVCHG